MLLGGVFKGRIIEIFGPESSAKLPSLHILAEAQKRWGCGVCDAEHALDRIRKVGVKSMNLFCLSPTAVSKRETVETLVSNGLDVIVIDSVATLTRELKLTETWAIHTWDCRRD